MLAVDGASELTTGGRGARTIDTDYAQVYAVFASVFGPCPPAQFCFVRASACREVCKSVQGHNACATPLVGGMATVVGIVAHVRAHMVSSDVFFGAFAPLVFVGCSGPIPAGFLETGDGNVAV